MTAGVTKRDGNGSRNTTVAALVHISGLLFGFFALVFVYLVSNDQFIRENAANALSWHVPASLVAVLVVVVGIGVSEIAGVALAMAVSVATVCFALIASTRAYQGRAWTYPIVPQLVGAH